MMFIPIGRWSVQGYVPTLERGNDQTVVIIDNAPTHTSIQFIDKLNKWEEKGLFVKYLPPYSPELNKIEILWRFIKYYWLPFNAYSSIQNLENELEKVLKGIGTEYVISFS